MAGQLREDENAWKSFLCVLFGDVRIATKTELVARTRLLHEFEAGNVAGTYVSVHGLLSTILPRQRRTQIRSCVFDTSFGEREGDFRRY